jgi:hypothetical protein
MTAPTSFELNRNAFGQLVLRAADGQTYAGVLPVRAFPIQSPEEGISMLHADRHEVAWIDKLTDLPGSIQSLIRDELQMREFMPQIQAILSVTSFSTPCTWHVKTDRGETRFVLRGDEDIRRVGLTTLMVTDSHGIQFLIRDKASLNKESRRILDRFL